MENIFQVKEYKFSNSIKKLYLAFLVFFTLGLFVCIYATLQYPNLYWISILPIFGYAYFTKIWLSAWNNRNNTILTTTDSIILKSKEKEISCLQWKEIHKIREYGYLENLKLINRDNKHITIDFEISDVNSLIKTITSKANLNFRQKSFRRNWWLEIYLSIPSAFILFAIIRQPNIEINFSNIALLSLFFLFAYVYINEIKNIYFDNEIITIHYPFRNKIIKKDNIVNVDLQIMNSGTKNVIFTIITLRNGEEIKVCGLKNGMANFYLSLKEATT